MPDKKGRTSSIALKGILKVTLPEPENKMGWMLRYYSFRAALQRKF